MNQPAGGPRACVVYIVYKGELPGLIGLPGGFCFAPAADYFAPFKRFNSLRSVAASR